MEIEKRHRIALFLDIENMLIPLLQRGVGFDIEPIIARLKEHGAVVLARSYGDIEKACQGHPRLNGRVRRMLQHNLIQIVDVPYITANKNTADLTLSLDALEVAFQYAEINTFALAACDRDYVPLINKLRLHDRHVIGIGIGLEGIMHDLLVQACDEFIYYENLVELPQEAMVTSSQTSEDYFDLLVRAVQVITEGGGEPSGGRLLLQMKQMEPTFNPHVLGYKSFREFVQAAERDGRVTMDWRNGREDFAVVLPGGETRRPRYGTALPLGLESPEDAAAYYNAVLAKKNVPMLPYDLRMEIVESVVALFRDRSNETWTVRQLQSTLWTRFQQRLGMEFKAFGKVIYTMYIGRCFRLEPGHYGEQPEDRPLSLGCDPDEVEHRLHKTYVGALLRSDPEIPLSPEAVSLWLYGDQGRLAAAQAAIEAAAIGLVER